MRAERIIQASIFDMFAGHEIGRELKAMSQWLDGHPTLVGLVADDLRRRGVTETGRRGLPAELVLRCGLLKQHRQLSYEELAFHLEELLFFPSLCATAVVMDAKEVGAAQDDQRHPRRDLGGDQPNRAGQRARGKAEAWQDGAVGQHGDRRPDA